MKRLTFIFIHLLWLPILGLGQVTIETIIAPTVVIAGESFRIQYIISNSSRVESFVPPDFRPFKLVSGPDVYPSVNSASINFKKQVNYIYTLLAAKPGTYQLFPTRAIVDGRQAKSEKLTIRVFPKNTGALRPSYDGDNSAYFLKPGENVEEKIKNNLFIRLLVDKQSCFIGEPILATFKLYSRLESKSDIVKNPGFYGFTVLDMINLDDKYVTTETIGTKVFDVHTIRKAQLYPLSAGKFTIDPMEISNRIEFSRSAVNKKTEQVIIEGMHPDNENKKGPGKLVFDNEMTTKPVVVNVKPFPEKSKPKNFSGATGRFEISASVVQNKLGINEEGFLEVTISGSGNFLQVSAPVIQWPEGLEGFEPAVKDSLSKFNCPLTGKRVFQYPFVSGKAGDYSIPQVNFSFFNPQTGKYSTLFTSEQQVQITQKKQTKNPLIAATEEKGNSYYLFYWILGSLLVISIIVFSIIRKSKTANRQMAQQLQSVPQSVEEMLMPARILLYGDEDFFYSALYENTWKYFSNRLKLEGSEVNKQALVNMLQRKKVNNDLIQEVSRILENSEMTKFTKVKFHGNAERAYLETLRLLKKLDEELL